MASPNQPPAPCGGIRIGPTWIREERGQPDRTAGIQVTGSLRQEVVIRAGLGGELEDRFALVGSESGIRLQHQRNGPRNDWRRLAGSAQAQIWQIRRGGRARKQVRRVPVVQGTAR